MNRLLATHFLGSPQGVFISPDGQWVAFFRGARSSAIAWRAKTAQHRGLELVERTYQQLVVAAIHNATRGARIELGSGVPVEIHVESLAGCLRRSVAQQSPDD
jgi:hypothetical protein